MSEESKKQGPFTRRKIFMMVAVVGIAIVTVLVASWVFGTPEPLKAVIYHQEPNEHGYIWFEHCASTGSTSQGNVTAWKLRGYDISNNYTAWQEASAIDCEEDIVEYSKHAKDDYIVNVMNFWNMSRDDSERFSSTFNKDGFAYHNLYLDRDCLILFKELGNGASKTYMECDDPTKHLVETKLSKIVALEFNKEYYVIGLNRMAELKELGYKNPSMTEAPSTTWEGKSTTKYIVIMEKP